MHEWSNNGGSATDLAGFEACLIKELDGELAKTWFNCQFFIEGIGLLTLAPLFYKEKITNQAVRDLVALCVAESSNDLWACHEKMIDRLAKEKNKAALDAWMVWVADTFVMVGSSSRVDASEKSLHFMSRHVMNATQLVPEKCAYLAIGMHNPNFVTRQYKNMSEVIIDRKASDSECIKNSFCIFAGDTK